MPLLIHTVFDPAPECPALARDAVNEELARVGMARLADDVCLLTSELVTNAVRHARTTLTLCLEWDGRCVRVEVRDGDRRPPRPGDGPIHEPGGLGLAIVDMISSRWGYDAVPDDGKVVWFELDAFDGELVETVPHA